MLVSGALKYFNVYRNENYNTISGTLNILDRNERINVREKFGADYLTYKYIDKFPSIKIKAYVTDRTLADIKPCGVVFIELSEAAETEKRAFELEGKYYKVKKILDLEEAEVSVRHLQIEEARALETFGQRRADYSNGGNEDC